ncbi:restriction endonuclease subunit S [Helicobacter himalayensis]|uniref:restriction endonuclease subunit S n=1 Tax=Helicobacter himalayensis TaxID=1591088 RepID=UPI003D6F495E
MPALECKWQEFKIGELFEKMELKKLNPLDTRELRVTSPDECHTIPAVVAKVGNNGVMYYVNKNDFETTSNKIVVIADGAVASGLAYYHEKEFTILHNAYAIKLKNTNETRRIGLYLAAVMQKSIFDFFSYENKPTWNKVKENSISLPVYADSKIAFDVMEDFIKSIEKAHIQSLYDFWQEKLNAYESVVRGGIEFKLEEYLVFFKNAKAIKNKAIVWREFKIGDLFEKISARFLGKGNKFEAVSKSKTNEFCIPVVYAKFGNNGIMYWAKNGDFETYENILSIVYNGAIATGKVYAQKEKTGILAESYFIRLKNINVSFEVNLFLQCVLEKVLYPKYSRDNLATWNNKVENDSISLPVYEDSQIAFDVMEDFIKSIEKAHIQSLYDFWQEKLNAYESVVRGGA